MENQSQKEYFEYLKGRSELSKLYRNLYLYPKLNRHLKGKIVDIGCGIGDFLEFNKSAIGIDINEYNVKYCKAKGLNAQLIDNGKYPFENSSVEGAILDNVLEHLEDPGIVLHEAYRILIKGGVLIVGVPGIKGYASDPDHKRFYNEISLEETLKRYGFIKKKFLYGPIIKSTILSEKIRQYCIYGVFLKN